MPVAVTELHMEVPLTSFFQPSLRLSSFPTINVVTWIVPCLLSNSQSKSSTLSFPSRGIYLCDCQIIPLDLSNNINPIISEASIRLPAESILDYLTSDGT
jgi:hypothetical protein